MLWKWWGAKESCDSVETVIYVLAFTEEENKMWKVAEREWTDWYRDFERKTNVSLGEINVELIKSYVVIDFRESWICVVKNCRGWVGWKNCGMFLSVDDDDDDEMI